MHTHADRFEMYAPGMTTNVFEQVIERTLDELPQRFRELLVNVEILVDEVNPEEPDIYGLYEGIPLTERMTGSMDLQLPDRVWIYRGPLSEDFGHDAELLATEIRVTVLHELAHYFGIDDDRLDELGWA